MKRIIGVCLIFFIAQPVAAVNYLLNGGQESNINYKMTQKIEPTPGIRKLILTYVVPATFESPTYSQDIEAVDFSFVPPPAKRQEVTDARGNKVITVTWVPPLKPITATIALKTKNTVKLKTLTSNASFPVTDIPKAVKAYLASTDQVASDDPAIVEKAKALTRTAKTEFDAVQKIITWVVDHMHYVLTPKSYDATYSFETGKGNCQNYSHLAAALMRAVGIPVRIVNGITMKKPYDVAMGQYIITMKLAEGRHSWIEIFFPDLGWIPSDAQGSQMFISNRFLRVEVGLDNNETEQDGLVSWSRIKGSTAAPQFSETIDARFETDTVDIEGKEMAYGPRESLFTPTIKAAFSEVVVEPPPPPPPVIPEKELKQLVYSEPFRFGNLEFPENVDFLTTRGPAQEAPDGTMKATKNFLVETAEYVTTKGQQYSQMFILREPIRLDEIGLALHKFSDDGQLWIELYRDNNGQPGDYIATSRLIILSDVGYQAGYSWVDFDFSDSAITLPSGRYWVALGFTGSPIVNWFFTYGKPVGPPEGTRYKKLFDEAWSRSLSFEFNYRVIGLAAKLVTVKP